MDGVLTDVEGDEFKSADAERVRTIKQGIVRAEKRKLVARMKLGRMRAKAEGRRICGEYFYGTDRRRPEEVATLARMRQLPDLRYATVVSILRRRLGSAPDR